MSDKAPDQNRQRQVQTQDLTESRLNDDFVFWLKRHGMNYLLVALLVACGFMGYNWWQRKQIEKATVAWDEFVQASLPESLEQVAKDHEVFPQVAVTALLRAADLRLQQIQTGEASPKVGDTPAVPLDGAGRKIAQEAADENYAKAADLATRATEGDRSRAVPVVVPSLFGRAAIAESRGDFDAARGFLEDAAKVAGDRWPRLVEIANNRLAGLADLEKPIALPKQSELFVRTEEPAPALPQDDLFNAIIEEQATGDGASGGDAPAAPETPAPATAPGG
jgi:hypothetical protein